MEDSETQERSVRLHAALQTLWEEYGKSEWDGEDDVLATLVQALLSQSTTNVNSDLAFSRLLEAFDADWDAIRRADVEDVIDAIRPGGLAKQKAPRIQEILERVHQIDGSYGLQHLQDLPAQEALGFLTSFRGVGPKTARFVLMFAAGAEVFPMDTHIFRILRRLNVLSADLSDTAAHKYVEDLLEDGIAHAAHMVLVEHGRACCHSRNPRCDACSIEALCPKVFGV